MLPNIYHTSLTPAGIRFDDAPSAQPIPHEKDDEARKRNTTEKITHSAEMPVDAQRQVDALKARDAEVRAHEQAHLNAARGIAISGATFSYQTGPDGNRYAVGGEVRIDTSPIAGDPEATLRKADAIRRAALAPSQPSSQDYSVASSAAAMASHARIELLKQMQENEEPQSGTAIDISV